MTKKLLFAAVLCVITYLCFSFFNTTFNIKLWSDGSRFICTGMFLFFSILMLTLPNKIEL